MIHDDDKETTMFIDLNGAIDLEPAIAADTLVLDGYILQRRLELELAAHEIERFTKRVEATAATR